MPRYFKTKLPSNSQSNQWIDLQRRIEGKSFHPELTPSEEKQFQPKKNKRKSPTWKRIVRRASGAVHVFPTAPATPPASSWATVPICDCCWNAAAAGRQGGWYLQTPPSPSGRCSPPPSTITPILASVCIAPSTAPPPERSDFYEGNGRGRRKGGVFGGGGCCGDDGGKIGEVCRGLNTKGLGRRWGIFQVLLISSLAHLVSPLCPYFVFRYHGKLPYKFFYYNIIS